MKRKNGSIAVYVVALVVLFLSFAALAIDGTIIFTYRMKLQNITETAALSAASEFSSADDLSESQIETNLKNKANEVFNFLKKDGLAIAMLEEINIDNTNNRVLLKSKYVAPPFFLAFLGVNGVNLNAQACAENSDKSVEAAYENISWVSLNASYSSDIIASNSDFHDTAILKPLGGFNSASYDSSGIRYDFISGSALSLGPGGYIMARFPAPLVNKSGYDLQITEKGKALDGYMVFVGLDNNPDNPYINNSTPGDGISWVNIGCSAKTQNDSNGELGVYSRGIGSIGVQNVVYGSAYFDLGDSCLPGISVAKYIKIIDDNSEGVFVGDSNSGFYKTILYGEASGATAGADISAINLMNYTKLVPASKFDE